MKSLTFYLTQVLAEQGVSPDQVRRAFKLAAYMQERDRGRKYGHAEHVDAMKDGIREGRAEWTAERGRETAIIPYLGNVKGLDPSIAVPQIQKRTKR